MTSFWISTKDTSGLNNPRFEMLRIIMVVNKLLFRVWIDYDSIVVILKDSSEMEKKIKSEAF